MVKYYIEVRIGETTETKYQNIVNTMIIAGLMKSRIELPCMLA